jgi:hypothetical protein
LLPPPRWASVPLVRAPALALVAAAALTLGLAAPTTARAQEPAPAAAPAPPAAGAPLPPAQMVERKMRPRERLSQRPSGFWLSNRPAQGGAYRYGKLLVGVVLVIVTGIGMLLAIRKYAGPSARPTTWPTHRT